TEARYKGQKTVVVSPDYSDHTKFADDWLPAQPGTDGALALAMGHVILREFHVERRVPWFDDYVRRFTDLPNLVELQAHPDGGYVAGRYLRAADLGGAEAEREHADWRTVVLDEATGAPVVPNGAIGDRWGEDGAGRWNLDLGDVRPALSLLALADETAELRLPCFDPVAPGARDGVLVRGV